MDRTILHSDMNCFYASIEHLHHPELEGKPLAVGGDQKERHGIIFTADYISRQYGVRTGMTIWQARKLCPPLTILPPRMDLYKEYSMMAHDIYGQYTDYIEPYGIDESWLDVTKLAGAPDDGEKIAKDINARVKKELGITNSVGVSWNKVFAKLGSDYKKPDAVTVFMKDSMDIIRNLPAKDLLYVGKRTAKKLESLGIYTIGHIADTPDGILQSHFGKTGLMLKKYALGLDDDPVKKDNEDTVTKSVGNSTTTSRDLVDEEDVKIIIYSLSEWVASRLKKDGVKGKVVELWVRDNKLKSFVRQCRADKYTDISDEIAGLAFHLFKVNYTWDNPVRSLGVRVTDLKDNNEPEQISLFDNEEKRNKYQNMDIVVDKLRARYGQEIIKRGMMCNGESLSNLESRQNHK